MALELDRLADEALAFSDLKEDFAYRHIPREKRQYYIAAGLAAGRQAAAAYKGRDLAALLRADGVEIRRFSEPSAAGLHAQICYDGALKQVDLFCATAQELSTAMEHTPWPVEARQLEEAFLAHEFYHWLEYSTGADTAARCEPVQARLLGLFPRRLLVRRTGEIAAFAFAKEVCGLAVHPKAMDYVLAYSRQGKGLSEIGGLLEALEAEYRAECL